MAVDFVFHRMLSLKCTGVNALSYPVHFNRSVVKLLYIGTIVKRKRVRCSNFQNVLLQGLAYIRHSKKHKNVYESGRGDKSAPCFNLAQNGVFTNMDGPMFLKLS